MDGRPNILLLVSDEERVNIPHPNGYRLPAHERLAQRGTSFANYYAASAMCSSSRSVIYTGRHMPITEIHDNDNMPYVDPLDPALGTIGTMLRTAGYYTTYQGKWHLSKLYKEPGDPSTVDALEPYGFSEWNDWGDIDGGAWAGLQVDPVIAGQAVKWLRERAPVVGTDQPWFMAVNFVNPHDIMSFDFGGTSSIQLPENLARATTVKPPAAVPLYQDRWDVALPATAHEDLSGAPPAIREYAAIMDNVFGVVADDDRWLQGLNFYLNCIRDVDRNVDVVLDALQASGQADRTIIIYTADHGDLVASHGLRQKGNLVYDENFHVPLIVAHPDHQGGTDTKALASAVDLAPTILDMAGIASTEVAERFPGLRGHSLSNALDGGTVRDGVLTAVEAVTYLDNDFWTAFGEPDVAERIGSGALRPDWAKRGFLRGYTDERYTFGRYFSPVHPNRPTDIDSLFANNDVVLFDRAEDPGECINVANDPASRELVTQLSNKLETLITEEIGDDTRSWVEERPALLGWPTWHGDRPTPGE